jgi:hypothetical protein
VRSQVKKWRQVMPGQVKSSQGNYLTKSRSTSVGGPYINLCISFSFSAAVKCVDHLLVKRGGGAAMNNSINQLFYVVTMLGYAT